MDPLGETLIISAYIRGDVGNEEKKERDKVQQEEEDITSGRESTCIMRLSGAVRPVTSSCYFSRHIL